ncbi:hypothetical protein AAVH_14825 [Aphelenchoides avenae]|nr:hypothetical protein AAVH_14825 [Aphelenchus avenae]
MKATLLVLALLCTLASAKFSIKPEDLAKKREFAERLLATYEDVSEANADNGSFVYVPHLENHPRRQKRASGFPGIFASCPPGYTGVQCETPVCQERANLTAHKGTDDTGDTIEFALSPACSSNVSVFVDAYQEKLFIFLHKTLPRSYPTGRLYGPDGKHIPQSEGQALGNNGNAQFYTWDNIQQYGAGIYTFSTASRSNANCAVQVESLTDDNVQQFLSEHQHTGVERDPKTGVPSYYGFKASGLEYPGSVDTVTFYVGVRKVQGPPMIVRPRYNCNAPSYVGPYICTKADMYHAKIRGLDYKGNFWQRVYEFHCDVSDLSPTPIPSVGPPSSSPTPITECFNGGILAKKNKGDGMQCFCGPFYAGDQCEQKLCLNGGTLGDQDICDCGTTNPLGYGGEFCQSVQCKAPSGENFDVSSRALAFVIRMTNKTATEDNIKSFARAANMITSYYAQKKPGYFQKHVLVFFGNKSTTFVKEYDSPEGMVLDIQNGTQYAVNDNSCFDSTLGAISDALRSPSMTRYLRSPIFVFSDALPSDDEFTEYSLYDQLSYFRGQIFNVLYHAGGDACVDPHAPGYTRLQGLSRFTHGLVTMQNASDIEEVARGISETLLGVDNLLSNDFLDSCSYASKYQTFFVDESVGTIYVLATGPQLSAQIKGPDNKIIQPTTQEIKGDLLVASFKTPVKGNYLLSISGPSAVSISCQYRVLGESNYDLFVGMARELTNDVQYKQPVFGKLWQMRNVPKPNVSTRIALRIVPRTVEVR